MIGTYREVFMLFIEWLKTWSLKKELPVVFCGEAEPTIDYYLRLIRKNEYFLDRELQFHLQNRKRKP